MRLLVIFWAAVELLQILVIGMRVVGYRNLQRKLDGGHNFARKPPPRSVTDES